MSECDNVCTENQEDTSVPVCGTDGRTYESRCDIQKAKCQGHPVEFKHNGKCVGGARCASQRASILRAQGDRSGMFIPECRDDGSYADVQCHSATGYCWCVDRQGKPLRDSSVKGSRPVCSANKGKKTNKRRSSRGRKNRKGCGPSDRASFNSNLIDIFQSEYNRVPHEEEEEAVSGTISSDPLRDTHEKRVVQWKFDQLDGDGDAALKRSEVRDLRRMARRIVRPRGCARTFAKFCDLDQDKRISRAEWAVCVGVDINNEQVEGLEEFLEDQPKDSQEEDSTPVPVDHLTEPWDRKGHVPRFHEEPPLKKEEEDENKDEEPQDCTSARITALEIDRQAPEAGTYIPECSPNGDYERAQCTRSPPYCWCVNPRTGRPVRGTATKGVKPDCAASRMKAKNFKGCPQYKIHDFLDELIKTFTKEMLEDAKNKSISIETPTAEKAARWKFKETDANNNDMLDKREWKIFKSEWRIMQKDGRMKRRLRKCWRNLPRFCDENDNQKIDMDEWLACTVTTRDYKTHSIRRKVNGKSNPFTTILKGD